MGASMLCGRCDYDLRGLEAGLCPECGRRFDPRDERSFAKITRAKRVIFPVLSIMVGSVLAILLFSVLGLIFGVLHT